MKSLNLNPTTGAYTRPHRIIIEVDEHGRAAFAITAQQAVVDKKGVIYHTQATPIEVKLGMEEIPDTVPEVDVTTGDPVGKKTVTKSGAYTHIASLVNWALRTKLTPAPVVDVGTLTDEGTSGPAVGE